MRVQLNLYRVSSYERAALIAALSYDVKRQIDNLQFSVNFCKPRLKLLLELNSHPKDTRFYWSDGQFGMVYRSAFRYAYSLRDIWCFDYITLSKWLYANRDKFLKLFPHQVSRYGTL